MGKPIFSSWSDAFLYFEGEFCDPPAPGVHPGKLRRSLDSSDVVQGDLHAIGSRFAFVNREEQCREMLRAFAKLELLRAASGMTYEIGKRETLIPLCVGLSGMSLLCSLKMPLPCLI